ncbi:MAG: hypothetical protein LUC33_02525 [Prevotellaceae bacterium]|nr:hypothetical protein [Prevotellaceae bacterium]
MTLTWPRLRQWGGNVLLSLFFLLLMLDPTGTILNIRGKYFPVIAYNLIFFRPSFRFLPHVILVYVAVTCSFISVQLQGNSMDTEMALLAFKAFAPLFLLLWAHHYDLVKLTLFPAVVTALVVCLIYGFSTYDESYKEAIYIFMEAHDETVKMSHRYFLGVRVVAIYYKSFVALSFALFYFYYKLYNEPRRWYLYILPALILTFAFLVSGTRATVLLTFFVAGLVCYRSVSRMGRWRYAVYPALAFFAIIFLAVFVALASERTEASNAIKYGHLVSFQDLFEHNPLYLLVGQGIGTSFYSVGFHRMTFTTEWSYLELLRKYGLFSLFILFTILYPFKTMWRYRRDSYCFGLMGTYFAYLLVAGTNPLLFASSGMIITICAYSYISKMT